MQDGRDGFYFYLSPLPQQVFGVFDGDGQVGAAEIAEDGEIYADDFSFAVEERTAGTSLFSVFSRYIG
jgi:hypothetical protein